MDEIVENARPLDERAASAKNSEDEINRLIEDYKPFLRARVAKYSQQRDEYQREELYSTALIAFYEAIKSYDMDKGHFMPFANNVVSKRLIDHVRKDYKNADKTVSLDEEDEDEKHSAQTAAIEDISIRLYEIERRREALADEIEQFKAELNLWGITMESLTNQSPKHKAVRDTYKMVVSKVSQSPDIMQTIRSKHYFPINSISKITGLPQKKLERARTFILASIIIKMGDYEYLSDYVCG